MHVSIVSFWETLKYKWNLFNQAFPVCEIRIFISYDALTSKEKLHKMYFEKHSNSCEATKIAVLFYLCVIF